MINKINISKLNIFIAVFLLISNLIIFLIRYHLYGYFFQDTVVEIVQITLLVAVIVTGAAKVKNFQFVFWLSKLHVPVAFSFYMFFILALIYKFKGF